jgi:uncharacterized protein
VTRKQSPHPKIAKGAILEWGTRGTILESGTQGLGGTRGLRDTQGVGGTPGVGGARAASTGIYFLLEGENFSAFHRLRSDEMWHFHVGSPLVVHVIDEAGEYSSIFLGDDPEAGQVFQAVVKAGCWFASEIARNPNLWQNRPEVEIAGNPHLWQNRPEVGHPMWALVGCTVAPGFEFEDFELAKRKELVRRFPRHRELIERLTRQ